MTAPLTRVPSGIAGLDLITHGGLPRGRTTLVSGTAGSAKTLLALQFLMYGISQGEPGVFLTFEERPEDVRVNAASLGWDIEAAEVAGLWTFVDASPRADGELLLGADFDLAALLARLSHAVRSSRANRVAVDSIGALFAQYPDSDLVRRSLLSLFATLRDCEATAVATTERASDDADHSRYGVEEFVADGVLWLRNTMHGNQRRRTIEVLKLRGAGHNRGAYPFTVATGTGLAVLPVTTIVQPPLVSHGRLSSGVAGIDAMAGGGFFADTIVLVSGATGTGKTLTAMHFAAAGVDAGEPCLIVAFEETREQLTRNTTSCGLDLAAMEATGLLRIEQPQALSGALEDHLLHIAQVVREHRPTRVVVDSLSALERGASDHSFRDFVGGLTSLLKQEGIAGMLTSTTPEIFGASTITEANVSTVTDAVVLLRYIEINARIQRGITVLKMRGSSHDLFIREYSIGDEGLTVGEPFSELSGILAGHPTPLNGANATEATRPR
ncbi:MAG TPA: circadian clock protein KaiC [Acidimicrobiales bacterium]|nr:circadian clock protein KaiC [Acidimicrobiales bacterium]